MKKLVVLAIVLTIASTTFAGGELPTVPQRFVSVEKPTLLQRVRDYGVARVNDTLDVVREAVDGVAGIVMVDPCQDDNRIFIDLNVWGKQ